MTWTRLSDNFGDAPAMLAVSRSARLTHVEGLVWCNKHLTDGALPANAVRRISDSEQLDADVAELVGAGVWTVDEDGAYQIDWTDQEQAEDVLARQRASADRQAKYRRRKSLHGSGDHSECDDRFCRYKGSVTGNVTRLVTPSRPVPSRPVRGGTGQGQAGGRTGSADASPADSPDRAEVAHYFTPNAIRVACTVCGGREGDALHYLAVTDCPHQRKGLAWSAGEFAVLNCDDCHEIAVEPGKSAEYHVQQAAQIVEYTARAPDAVVPAPFDRWFPDADEVDEWFDADPDAADLAQRLALTLYAHAGRDVDGEGQPVDERLVRALFAAAFLRMHPERAEAAR